MTAGPCLSRHNPAAHSSGELELTSWRRMTSELYAAVRADDDPQSGHTIWRRGRDEMFRSHPQSPLPPGDPLRTTGLPYWPYDPELRFEVPLLPAEREVSLSIPTTDGVIAMARIGWVRLPPPLDTVIDVWWLRQYAGGLFLPLRDGTAGQSSYGGGRYALDTAKGADLGMRDERLIIDLNFLYHPSCRYNDAWQCPLAPAGNTISAPVSAGERLLARYPDRRRVIIKSAIRPVHPVWCDAPRPRPDSPWKYS
jgi:uncharacterized protein